jgi:benzoyl-CoA reductase/2-hydroxyglutaryl-CoA dehydratase subunit BcrC/BadD/HgdB
MCSFAAAWLEMLQQKNDAAESFIAVFTSACDQMRRAFDLFSEHHPQNGFLLNVPSTTTSHAFAYYLHELRRLQACLCALSGLQLHRENLSLSSQSHTIGNTHAGARIKIAITGGPVAPSVVETVGAILNAANAEIVLNTTENAMSPYSLESVHANSGDPLEALARAYFDMPAIWKRPNTAFYEWAVRLARHHGVHGVILFRHNWCDLWHSQSQQFHKHLSLPVLELDLDGKAAIPQSACSRLEAFMEALA